MNCKKKRWNYSACYWQCGTLLDEVLIIALLRNIIIIILRKNGKDMKYIFKSIVCSTHSKSIFSYNFSEPPLWQFSKCCWLLPAKKGQDIFYELLIVTSCKRSVLIFQDMIEIHMTGFLIHLWMQIISFHHLPLFSDWYRQHMLWTNMLAMYSVFRTEIVFWRWKSIWGSGDWGRDMYRGLYFYVIPQN